MSIPLPVLQFAMLDSLDGGITPAHPIAWAERADRWVIVYEDGRKITHLKTEAHEVPIRSQVDGAPETRLKKQPGKHRHPDKERNN